VRLAALDTGLRRYDVSFLVLTLKRSELMRSIATQ